MKNIKSIHGVGYLGVGKYTPKNSPHIYPRWGSMVGRCHKTSLPTKNLCYEKVFMCEEWLNFQNFAEWFELNHKDYMKDWDIDKDLLSKNNKIYSPEHCCFIPKEINYLITNKKSIRGKYPAGVTKARKGFVARCYINSIRVHLGTFNTPEEAFAVYKEAKETEIKRVANKWRGLIDIRVYEILINYEVKITD